MKSGLIQPPKDIDDSWIVNEILDTIPLIDPEIREIGFTGNKTIWNKPYGSNF